ncbi:MAG: hypothetical protein MUD01_18280 [Chloroflexaceae bacterium]|jgi:hypothetical protein|nr:hypothetical protein [Chloroflexaceae bacterium]
MVPLQQLGKAVLVPLVLLVSAGLAWLYALVALGSPYTVTTLFFPAFILGSLYGFITSMLRRETTPIECGLVGALNSGLSGVIMLATRPTEYSASTGNFANDALSLALQLAIIGAVSGGVAGYVARRS